MLLNVIDGLGTTQKILAPAQEAVADHSGTIGSTGVAQVALVANLLRSGFFLQNLSSSNLFVNDTGTATTGAGSILIAPGTSFPLHGYPVVTGAISILGTVGAAFTVREW